MVPLINDAGRTLRWFIADVRGLFGDDYARHGAPLFPSERHDADGSAGRAGAETLRAGLAAAAAAHPAGVEAGADPARAAALLCYLYCPGHDAITAGKTPRLPVPGTRP